MKTPYWLMSGALLFWGWETGLWIWGILMAAALGGAKFVRARWEFSETDLNRISDLCWVLFLGAGMLLYSTEDRLVFIFKFAQWLPFSFFPVMLAQAYGNREEMTLSVFSWLLRRTPQSPLARKSFNISYPYFAICVTGASASTRADGYFYAGITVLVLLALTSVRPRRASWPVWIVLMALVAGTGYASQRQLRQLQNTMEGALGGWLADFFRAPPDSHECRTLIGHTGRISLSGKIALRLRVPPGDICPALLREGAYDAYKNETWWASSNDLGSLCQVGSNDVVRLLPAKPVYSEVEIARYYDDGAGPLALPHGTFEIDDLPAMVRTNRLGVAEMAAGPGLADLRARYGRGVSMESPPGRLDLGVPDNETNALSRVGDDLRLSSMTERQKIRAVERFFGTHFTYSLNGRPRSRQMTPLAWFLTEGRSGHCEYFATATVLLLRQAGVAARYITGYAVPDSARRGDTYLIRERHAHAWALVYHSDTHVWEQIDTTPGNWDQADGSKPPWWESTTDFFSDVYFQFSKWRWSKTSFARGVDWLLVPLILYLVARILTTQRRQRAVADEESGETGPAWPGLDSELYLINQRLAGVHLARLPNEPLHHWQQRLEGAFPDSPGLRRIFHLHRRLRFDPRGLESGDREVLRREANAWLDGYAAQSTGAGSEEAARQSS
jgi:hypothetical protein